MAMAAGDAIAYNNGGDVLGGVVCQDMSPEPGLCPKNRGGHHGELCVSD